LIKQKAVLLSVGYDFPRLDIHMPIAPPLGILALGSYLEAHGVAIELIDVQVDVGFATTARVERLICKRVARYLASQAESIAWIGISMLSNVASGLALGKAIRAALPDTPIVYGGYYPTSVYRRLLEDHPFVTAVVRSDGEAAALEISRLLAAGESLLSPRVPNLAWRQDGRIRTNPVRPMRIEDLPNLNYRLLHNKASYPFAITMLSRGCPFRCNYCLEQTMRPYAAYSLDWARRQFDHLEAELRCSRVGILDPIFAFGRKRTLEIVEIIGGRRFSYAIESRVDVLTPDLIPHLRRAGVDVIFWGLESGSAGTLERMGKIPSRSKAPRYLDAARAVLRACMENDVVPFVGLMFGFPGDTEADYRATLSFVEEMGRLQEDVLERTGVQPGFVPYATSTIVYDGTPLAKSIPGRFPGVRLRPEPVPGGSTVVSPGPGATRGQARQYARRSMAAGGFAPSALGLLGFSTFLPRTFVAAHPELTDAQGVTVISRKVRRLG
jgi:anaerobic magnesium-protoporphyrin IX monomethyl ester cyclase